MFLVVFLLLLSGVAQAAEPFMKKRRLHTPVLVVLGGFRGCAERPNFNQIRLKFEPRVQEFRRYIQMHYGEIPRTIRGCFVNSPKEGNVYYFNGPKRKVYSKRVSRFLGPGREQSEELAALVRSLGENIKKYVGESKNLALFVVGHSQGAWLATGVTQFLLNQNVPISGLMTLDPISPLWCTLGDYVEWRGVPKLGCTQPPPEWDAKFIFPLFEGLGEAWFNFYQNQFPFLHSGPLPVLDRAGQNFKLAYGWKHRCPNPHSCVDEDKRAWNFFMNQSVAALNDLRLE